MTLTPTGATLAINAKQTGASTNYFYSFSSTYDTAHFSSPSFGGPSSGVLSGGVDQAFNPATIYSYTLGFEPNGNVASLNDSVLGTWNYGVSGTPGYDDMNRLVYATSTAGSCAGMNISWAYDRYGNRWSQNASGSSGCTIGQPSFSYNTGNNNRIDQWQSNYDASGDLLKDAVHTYTYDAEGRISSVVDTGTQYVYDAEGRRVAKKTGGAVSASYVLGLGGEQVTEINGSNQWVHSSLYANGGLLATYDTQGTRFHLTDAQGSRRVQARADGTAGLFCSNYPLGDGLACWGPDEDSTEHHFTGKERDTESGNDYFGARYYGSNMGRFMSPDPLNLTEERLVNPANTLNKYAYAANNPLKYVDPDGQDITYFYDQGGPAGHAVLFAYNQATGDSAIESFGPASKSLLTRAREVDLEQVPGKSMFDMDVPKSADDLRQTYAALTIQTSPELAQQVINYIRQNPDPATWGVLGSNCSTQVWKILRRFKLARYDVGGGMTPKIVWADLYTQYVNNWRVNVPTGGNDYGHSRCGSCMFDFLWQSLPQSHEKVTSRIVPDSVKPVDNPE